MQETVLNVAYPFAPVGFDAAGGAEQIVALLDLALVEAGHRSIVIACEGSRVHGTLIPTGLPRGALTAEVRSRWHESYRETIRRAIERYSPDVVHLHGLDFSEYLPAGPVRAIATLHLPISWYPQGIFALEPRVALVCVSESQRRHCPPSAGQLTVIENGVPVERFLYRARKWGFALCLGRICPEKGFHLALDAAARARVPLVLAGRVHPYEEHERYFREEILPRLGPQARFIGPAGMARKRRLLAGARCVLVPSMAEETSSLSAMEALASGTPVVAFGAGALAEIVEHGKTGFLVANTEEMAVAIAESGSLRAECCRARACSRFSWNRAARQYLELYEKLDLRQAASGRAAKEADAIPKRASEANAATDAPIPRFPATLEIEEIVTREAWAAIESEWRDLIERCPDATPFQSPDWLLPWWDHFGRGDLWVLCVRRRGRLKGLVPLFVHEHERRKAAQISLAGMGNSDYLTPLIEPEDGREAAELLLRHLAARRDKWRVADLQALSPDSPLLLAAQGAGLRVRILRQDVCPVLSLPRRGAELMTQLPAKLRRDLRRSRRALESRGEIRVERARMETLADSLEALFRLHGSRWEKKNEPGVLRDSEVQSFQMEASVRLLRAGVLRLDVLFWKEQAAAAIWWMNWRRRAYLYLSGFSPGLEDWSPGAVLLQTVLERAIAEGVREADFLRGGEAYKYAWGARDRIVCRIFLSQSSGARDVRTELRLASGA